MHRSEREPTSATTLTEIHVLTPSSADPILVTSRDNVSKSRLSELSVENVPTLRFPLNSHRSRLLFDGESSSFRSYRSVDHRDIFLVPEYHQHDGKRIREYKAIVLSSQ